tara:strand:- start:4138 stop:5061 length:924 start_codon:yes stop_codon:yes gene_type:complete
MQFKDNKDLYDTIKALAGVNKFTPDEQLSIKSLANRRLYEAYNKTDIWPRYLIVSEPRSIANSIVPTTQDGRHILGAGTTAVNGLYKLNGTQASAAAYSLFDSDGTTELYSLIYVSGTTWHIIVGAPASGGAIEYINTAGGNTATADSPSIAEIGWTVSTGTAPAPTVRDLAEITDFIKIHRTQSFLVNSAIEFDFFVQGDGAHVLNLTTETTSTVYCTYRKALTYLSDLDEDTLAGVLNVPLEFFYFVAHATYADFLRSDGQTEKAFLEENRAEDYLFSELERAEKVMNINAVKKRIVTHVSRQSR